MSDILLKNMPEDLQAQLEQEASANFRTLDQEALARIAMSFQIQEAFSTRRVQGWIDEALASGPATPLTREEFEAAYQRALSRFQDPATAVR
jgi:hypothetical protein